MPSKKAIESLKKVFQSTLPPETEEHKPFWDRSYKHGMRMSDIKLPESGAPDYPDSMVQLAFEQLKSEYPKETQAASQPKPMNWFHKNVSARGGVMATAPWGSIVYDQDQIRQLPRSEIADVLAHELTHVKQFQGMPMLQRYLPQAQLTMPYMQRPLEQEAFAAMEKRRAARRDIPLPPTP